MSSREIENVLLDLMDFYVYRIMWYYVMTRKFPHASQLVGLVLVWGSLLAYFLWFLGGFSCVIPQSIDWFCSSIVGTVWWELIFLFCWLWRSALFEADQDWRRTVTALSKGVPSQGNFATWVCDGQVPFMEVGWLNIAEKGPDMSTFKRVACMAFIASWSIGVQFKSYRM